MDDATARFRDVTERIASAAARSGRPADAVTLVGATKTVPAERIAKAIADGLTDAGENRVQELLEKMEELEGAPVRWHFIGSLQRNKVSHIVGRVAMIHSIDRQELAEAVGRAAHQRGVVVDVLVEVNATGEGSKHGVDLLHVEETVAAVAAVEGLALKGLMTMGTMGDTGRTRRAFAAVREAADRLGLGVLSMGMSDDFEVAIEEGATIVRVGSALFGPRDPMRG